MLAHTCEDGRRQSLQEHLVQTAALAADYAESFGCGAWGYLAGLAHDIGKCSPQFQSYLLAGGPKTEHAAASAMALYQPNTHLLAYCGAGHHAGLPDGGTGGDTSDMPTLRAKLARQKKYGWDIPAYTKALHIPLPQSLPAPPIMPFGRGGFSFSFFTRMLFSCLVDADFLDTEAFMNNSPIRRGDGDTLETLLGRLDTRLQAFTNPQTDIHRKRCEVLQSCQSAALSPRGLYTLTVPTGGGKTLSSFAFALRHAVAHGLRRIIYVIPYTSIIEQTADIFRGILGADNVLEHHSNVHYDDTGEDMTQQQLARRHASENWDVPVIVTTNVQFFESLFANKTSQCRKLHNIANSAVIFDEAQMLPVPYLRPCVRAIAELVQNYRCTALLCTATQPALDTLFPEGIHPTEICPARDALYQFFRRVRFVSVGEQTVANLAGRLNTAAQALCIVNTRMQAQAIFKAIQGEGAFHLSTLMYPAHRRRTLDEIRERLKRGLPCRVVSTSLIEAGVDVDFPVVYREEAGLDSIIQAAGRCNREGRRSLEESIVYIFRAQDEYASRHPASLRLPTEVARQVMQKYADIAAPESIHEYFNLLIRFKGASLDQKNIVEAFEKGASSLNFPFASVAQAFRIIEQNTRQVLIPLESEPEARLTAEMLRQGVRSRTWMRKAGQYSVNVYDAAFLALLGAGALEVLDEELAILRDTSLYDPDMGLQVPDTGIAVMI